MLPALFLVGAISTEVFATASLRMADGFERPVWLIGVGLGYLASFGFLSLCLKHLEVGLVYAVWAGCGTAAIAIIGVIAWNESVSFLKFASIGLIIVGVIGLNLSGATH